MADIDSTLVERGARYGKFSDHAKISQDLEDVARATPGWARLNPSQKESLKLQWHKQARILNGDPNYDDSWRDIAGYSQLIVDELNGTEKGVPSTARPVPAVTAIAPFPEPATPAAQPVAVAPGVTANRIFPAIAPPGTAAPAATSPLGAPAALAPVSGPIKE